MKIALLFLCLFHLFFVPVYWNDKSSTAVSIVESMNLEPAWFAKEVPCVQSGSVGSKASWAEEPPIFHIAGILLKRIGFQNLYVKVLPLICCIFLILGLLKLLEALSPNTSRERVVLLPLLMFTPFLFIHASRFLPDQWMVACIPWFFFYFLRKKYAAAWAFATLAVTAKATAIFLVVAAMMSYFAFSRETKKQKGIVVLLFSLSIVPMLAWLVYLKANAIDNPFFSGNFSLQRHSGGADFSILVTLRYWARFFTWVVIRGVSIPLFLLFLWAVRPGRERGLEEKIVLGSALGIVPYWIMVRGPQFSAPWYSFPFLVPMLAIAALGFFQVKSKVVRGAVLGFLIVYSVSAVAPSRNWKENIAADIKARPIMVKCSRQNL